MLLSNSLCLLSLVTNLTHFDLRRKYPVPMNIYNQSVGRLLPHRICQILEELGYETWMNPRQGNGVDIKAWFNGSLILVIEVLNWSIGSHLSDRRFRSMIDNFSEYNCAKVLIYTVLEKDKVEKFESNEIITLEIGYQFLPKQFYYFFKQKGQSTKRESISLIVVCPFC